MWRSFNISRKIYCSIALIIAGYSLSMVYVFIEGNASQTRLEHVAKTLFPAALQSRAASNAFKQQLKSYEDAATLGEPKHLALGLEKRNACIGALRDITGNSGLPADDRSRIMEDIIQLQNFAEQAETTYALMAAGKAVQQGYATGMLNKARDLDTRLETLSSYFSQKLKDEIATTSKAVKRSQTINGYVFILVVVPSLAILTIVLASIIRRLNTTVSRIRYVSHGPGNLDTRIDAAKGQMDKTLPPAPLTKGDEIVTLAESFDQMATALQISFRNQEALLQQLQQRNAELTASEERFSQLFRQNDDALFLLEMDTFAIIDCNSAALQLFGLPREDLNGQNPLTSLVDKQDLELFIQQIRIDVAASDFLLERAAALKRDGTKLVISMRGKILHIGTDFIIFCSIRDMTEKVRLEEDIKVSQAKLIQANKMTALGMLVSGVAHEINNPNQCIAVNTSVLTNIWRDAAPIVQQYCAETGSVSLGGLPSQEIQEMVPQLFSGIADSSQRINAIVANMRDYVRGGRGRQTAGFDLNRIITNATAILWHNIKKHTDNFRQELAEGIPPAHGDAQQVEQVVINLLMNALQSLPDKSHEVSVATLYDEAAGQVVITVKDTGKGMDRKTLQRLTEPFFTTREQEGGTGLGIYISTTIIKEYDGSLEFDSEPGKGTTATIRLPRAVGHRDGNSHAVIAAV